MTRTTRRGRREPRQLGDVVHTVLEDLGLDGGSQLTAIAQRWEHVVGPVVAAHSQPSVLRGRILEVAVDSSVWCQQLALRRAELVAGLRAELGDDAPDDVWFRQAGRREPPGAQ